MTMLPEERRAGWREMAHDHIALDNLELSERVESLECDAVTLRVTLSTCLDTLRRMTVERDDLRRLIDFWTADRRRSTSPPRRAA